VSVAEVGVTPVTGPVTAGGADEVVKIPSAPRLLPAPFVATTR